LSMRKQEQNQRRDFWLFGEGTSLAIVYLVALVGAEVVTNFFSLVAGVICHTVLLATMIFHSVLATEPPSRKLPVINSDFALAIIL